MPPPVPVLALGVPIGNRREVVDDGRATAGAVPCPLSFHNSPCPFSQGLVCFVVGKGVLGSDALLSSKDLSVMSLVPPGVKDDQDQRPRWLGNYSVTYTNIDYLPIAAMSDIQYERAVELLIREVVLLELSLVPIYLLKTGVSNRFYRITLQPRDAPKLDLVSP